MVKAIEAYGIPVVHIATVVPISQTVGANRIVPAVAIPHPLGNPALTHEEEKEIRTKMYPKHWKLYRLRLRTRLYLNGNNKEIYPWISSMT